jgi:hypothetical protein
MTDFELGWVVGIFEGEGYAGPRKLSGRSVCPVIAIGMTDEDVIKKVASLIGATAKGPLNRGPKRKLLWLVRVFGDRAIALGNKMLPHLGARRTKQVMIMLEAAKYRLTPREAGLRASAVRWGKRSSGMKNMFAQGE